MAQQQASTVAEYPAARLPSVGEYCRIAPVGGVVHDRQMVALSHPSTKQTLLKDHE